MLSSMTKCLDKRVSKSLGRFGQTASPEERCAYSVAEREIHSLAHALSL